MTPRDLWAGWLDPSAPARRAGLLHVGVGAPDVALRVSGGRPVYLATPYTLRATGADGRLDPYASAAAADDAARAAAALARFGVAAVSPIVLAAAMCDHDPCLDPLDDAFWTGWCRPLLDACGAVVVPAIDGWADSRGVAHEVAVSLGRMRPVLVAARGVE